ncbi:MAG: YafY family protein [Terricaulis sp.]
MRSSRLLSILMLVQMRGRVSATTLAREFEVSVRTIYRDVDALSAAGVPIYAEAGRNGGVALLEGYRTRLTGLTPGEAAALPLAGLAEAARDLGVGVEAASAHLKLLASLPADSGASAQRIAQRFHLDSIPWHHRAEHLDCLPPLATAVWQEKQITVEYESWSGAIARQLDPLGLVQKGGIWYLVAGTDGQVRTYRVSNIRRLVVSDVAIQRPARFDLQRYWSQAAMQFESKLTRERARVRISPEGRRILRAVNPAAEAVVTASQKAGAPEGWIEADMPIEGAEYSARQLLRLGTEMEVLAPERLRDAVAREARAVLALHKRKSKLRSDGRKLKSTE